MEEVLWVEKYRPQSITDYVFVDERQKQQVEGWIKDGSIPHLLLSGEPGTGKTTLAKLIVNTIKCDSMIINASDENNVDTVRTKVKNFASSVGFAGFKVIILDEFDYMTPNAQAILTNLMETFSKHCRFILTCNYEYKIIPALRESRFIHFHIARPDPTEFTTRTATVLINEGVEFGPNCYASMML